LAAGTIVWTYFGQFDIVATAQGKIQPTGRVKVVQSLETGKTVSIHVANGATVKAGDVLLKLDETEISAERTALAASLAAHRAEVLRRDAVVAVVRQWRLKDIWKDTLRWQAFRLPADIPEAIAEREQLLYNAELARLLSSLNNLAAQRRERQAETDRLSSMISAQKALVATLSERVGMRSALAEKGAGTRAGMIDAVESLQKEQTSLTENQGRSVQSRAAVEVVTSEAAKLVDTFLADNMERLSQAARKIDELEQQLVKAQQGLELMNVRSPIDGTVQASALTTIGQVVTAGSEIMRIVPAEATLEIEAYLPNRDVGFVTTGQRAVIKIEAFPFTRYGVVEGHVTRVATDAIPEPDAEQVEGAAVRELRSIVPTGNAQRIQNLVFPITIQPDRNWLMIDGKKLPLSSGMAVSVEVKTGSRRIIEYLSSPLAEVASEAMQER
jgi:hemolysin D